MAAPLIPQPDSPGGAGSATIGRYQIRDRLGEGGMGVLYLALDPAIDRLLALKVLRADSVELRERFIREAQFAARLQHPHIVTIYDVGTHEGQPFIAMEYIPGETLGELIRRRAPLTVSRRLLLMADVCQGLAYAHKRKVIHRDVKPANLMVSRDTGTVKILDFGIARGGDSALTQAGALVGTANYMSPEQVRGDAVDHRSDIFAVGAVLHELLVYRRAFSDPQAHVVLHKIINTPHQPVIEINRGLPPAIQPILDCAMAKRAADRYPDLDVLRNELMRLAQQVAEDEAADTVIEPGGAHAPEPERERRSDAGHLNKARLAERRAARIGAHIRAAHAALSADRCDEALAEAELAEELDPDHPSVVAMLTRVRAVVTARDVARALEEVRQHLQTGALSAAGAALARAGKLAPGSPDIQALRRQLDAAVEERERARALAQKADAALAQARESLRAGVLDVALRAIIEALGYEPEREEALALRQEIDEEIERRVENVVALADRDMANGQVAAAIDRLARFAPRHARISAALDRARHESARQVEAQRLLDAAEERQAAHDAAAAREAKVQAHVQAARTHADAGDFAAALAHLGSAVEIAPAHAAIAPVRAAIEQQRAAAEERARREAHDRFAAAAVFAARAQFKAGLHQQALRRCERFTPPHPLVTDLHRELSAQLAAIEQERAAAEQRAHDARLAQLRAREEEERARLAADVPTFVPTVVSGTLATPVAEPETPVLASEAPVVISRLRAARKTVLTWAAAAAIAIPVTVGTWLIVRQPSVKAGPPPSTPSAGDTAIDKTPAAPLPPSSKDTLSKDTSPNNTLPNDKTLNDKSPNTIVPASERLSTLLVDASPWGRIVRIVDAKGRALDIPGAYTPVTIPVAAGTYTVTLERDGKRRSERVTIGEREQRTARVEFEPVDTAEFFRNQP